MTARPTSIYPNNTPNCNPVDRDEGAERVGMGVLLAKQYLLSDKKDNDLKSSLSAMQKFLRTRLQTPEYVTYSSVDQKNRNRAYNYVWIAEFYFYMYRATETDSLSVTVAKRFVPCFASSVMAFTASVIRYV